MQIIGDKALLLRTKNPQQIKDHVRKSKVINQEGDEYDVAVHWGLDEAQALAALSLGEVPSPILRDYKWTGKFTPFAHQKKTASFLTLHQKAFCFSDAGTGKTAAAIWAADYLMRLGLIKRVLVICPLSIMKAAWQQDLFKFAMHRSCATAHGSAAVRKRVINDGAEFVIINFDGLATVKEDVIAAGFDLIIVDEATAYKNAQTARWKVLRDVALHSKWLWMMTGTPAAQSPLDAYGLAKLVNPDALPRYWGAYRDQVMYKVTQFKWAPKKNAQDVVHRVLQPAIRFEKSQCLDLPPVLHVEREAPLTPMQTAYYNKLKNQMRFEAADESVTAVNAATSINKLLQISCIAKDTPVLTRRGWVCIQQVTASDEVWDGMEWVRCAGSAYMGDKPVVWLDGVALTSDHKVLTVSGWRTVAECIHGLPSERLDRAAVRLPDSPAARRDIHREVEESDMALSVRLRGGGSPRVTKSAVFPPLEPTTLRMSYGRVHREAPHVVHTALSDLGKDAEALHQPDGQGLQELRRAGDYGAHRLGGVFRRVLEGYVRGLRRAFDAGADRQRRAVHSSELPVGNTVSARKQPPYQHTRGDPGGSYDCDGGVSPLRGRLPNPTGEASPGVAGLEGPHGPHSTETYDVLNCGPRNRYVVQGRNGELLIVHNCGAVYTDTGEVVEFDISNRINVVLEAIEEAANKVLVFVPFTHTIELLRDALTKHKISCDVLNGAVPMNRRSQIIEDFQKKADPHVLLIQPQAAAHGLTLTAADTVIWYAPVTSVETYLQANARIDRPGQKNNMTVVHIQGSDVEAKLYAMLRTGIMNHTKIVDLYRRAVDDTP